MSLPINHHLTDEQFTECAFAAPEGEVAAHLATCAQCREELATFDDTMADFGRTTAAWSQAMPMASLRGKVKQQQRASTVRVAWAFAAALLVAVTLPLATAHHETSLASVKPVAAVATDSAAQIAQDNQLMQNVYMALTTDDSDTLREYNIPAAGKSSHADTRTRIQ